jgi:hypothetical protein
MNDLELYFKKPITLVKANKTYTGILLWIDLTTRSVWLLQKNKFQETLMEKDHHVKWELLWLPFYDIIQANTELDSIDLSIIDFGDYKDWFNSLSLS